MFRSRERIEPLAKALLQIIGQAADPDDAAPFMRYRR